MRRRPKFSHVWPGECRFAQERIRQRQERSISGVREGLAEGGEALGMGFYRGMTGLVSKPLEGAQSRGLTGFVKVPRPPTPRAHTVHVLMSACSKVTASVSM